MDDLYKGRLRAGDEYVSCLFDGANFVYVFGQNDSIYVATADHKNVKGYNAKSKYLKPAKYIPKPHYAALNGYLRESNQQQFYHYIYYDKYREVYYRLAYPESEVDPKENQQDIWSFGRRTCSIVFGQKLPHHRRDTVAGLPLSEPFDRCPERRPLHLRQPLQARRL